VSQDTGKTEVLAELWISGRHWDPNDCTGAVDLQPTRIWQGKPFLRARADLPTDAWVIGTPKRELYSIDEAVRGVLDLVWPARARIRAFVKVRALRCTMSCNVFIYGDVTENRPIYELSASTIEQLSDLGAAFSMDLFVYSE